MKVVKIEDRKVKYKYNLLQIKGRKLYLQFTSMEKIKGFGD